MSERRRHVISAEDMGVPAEVPPAERPPREETEAPPAMAAFLPPVPPSPPRTSIHADESTSAPVFAPAPGPVFAPSAGPAATSFPGPAPVFAPPTGPAFRGPPIGHHPGAPTLGGPDVGPVLPISPSAPLADLGVRVGAALIDGLLVFGALLAIYVVFGVGAVAALSGGSAGGAIIVLVIALVAVFASSAYLGGAVMGRTDLRNGQTFGMQMVGCRKVRLDGQSISVGYGLFILLVPNFLFSVTVVGYLANAIWPLTNDRRQSLRDLVGKTVVVSA